MKDDVLPLPSNICYVGHSLCSSCDGYSVLNYKQYKFLVEILELLVFFGLCHAFHRHTLSQHNPLGYLNFILYSPQYTQKFCLHISKAEIEVQTTWMHTYGCFFFLSHTHALDSKKIFSCHGYSDRWNTHPFTYSFGRSSQITFAFSKSIMRNKVFIRVFNWT